MLRAHGVLRVTHGTGLARVLARLLRLPRAGDAVDTRLAVTPSATGDHWRRTFDGRHLDTWQYARGHDEMVERFGSLELRFRRDTSGESVVFRQLGAALVAGPLRIPLPRACAPAVTAREDRTGPRTRHVDVRVALPIVGTLLSYAGSIEVDEAAT
jgi:hypothetical protein